MDSDLPSSYFQQRMAAPYYDPYDYEIDADPHPVWRRLRDEAPLYRNDKYDFWALSRFADVYEASVDWRTFSSARGTVLELIDKIPEPRSMIFQDPPEHEALRKLVSRAFSPRRIAELEARTRALVVSYLDPQVGSDGFDYVGDFGARLPAMVIGSMLGVPAEDQDQIRLWTDAVLHREPGETHFSERLRAVHRELWGYFWNYLQERRRTPRDDMMTDLLEAEVVADDGSRRRLTDPEVLSFIALLSGAGNETVARLLGWAGFVLARYPGERAKLVADPGRIPNAVEELLRFEAPSPVQARTLTRDVELHGTRIAQGSCVLLLTGSAGRDDRVFDEPDTFRVDRKIDRHVSFGYGIHFCLGASLARMEGRIALEETLRRFPEWTIDEAEAEMVHTSTVRGWARLPIHLR